MVEIEYRRLACEMLEQQIVAADLLGRQDFAQWLTRYSDKLTPDGLMREVYDVLEWLDSPDLASTLDYLDYSPAVQAAYKARIMRGLNGEGKRYGRAGKSSRYYGVSWDRTGKFSAKVYLPGNKSVFCGFYMAELDAAQAVNDKIVELGLSKPLNVLTY